MPCSCGQSNPILGPRCSRCNRRLILGMSPWRVALDAAAAVSLLIALVAVMSVDPTKPAQPTLEQVEEVDAAAAVSSGSALERPLRLAVTPPCYDDMGKLLDSLGEGYRYTTIADDDLLDPKRLAPYDVVFLTCAGAPRQWLGQRLAAGQRDSEGAFEGRPEVLDQVQRSLRQYVARGGTLYASDWQYQFISRAFPEMVDRSLTARGAAQTLKADVLDPGLERHLGPTIELRFDKPAWRPAAFVGSSVTVYLRGSYKTVDGAAQTAPLLVAFGHANGSVIFTSFHNEAQNTQLEQKLLKYLVFATVTAQVDALVKRTMLRGGFSPRERNLLSASSGDQSVAQTYTCRDSTRKLQFVLGFENRGAELELTVIGPDGDRRQKSGRSTVTIEVSNPPPGEWQYTIRPLKVPYPNFPFTITVGEKQ